MVNLLLSNQGSLSLLCGISLLKHQYGIPHLLAPNVAYVYVYFSLDLRFFFIVQLS